MFNANTDTEQQPDKFHGFYRGVVITNTDPKKNGRIQVKIYPMFENVLDEDLPWALYADAGMGGSRDIGSFNVPEVGSHVFCFFENGDHRYPVYFAGAPAIENNVPDVPKLSREDDGTHAAVDAARKVSVSTAGGGSWSEPASAYNPTYPSNKVLKTSNGMVVELDDSEGNVRLHIYHPSGTRHEVNNAGNVVDHVVGSRYTVVIGSDNVKIDGVKNITVDGNVNLKVGADLVADVTGNLNATVGGAMNATVTGNTTIDTAEAHVIATTAKVESTNVQLDSAGVLGNIVTTNHVCAFTGAPHPQGSATCKAGG